MQVLDGKMMVEEYAPGWTLDDIQHITGAQLVASPVMREISLQ